MRDPKTSLDINKTRQIAQEIIKVKDYPAGSRVPGHPLLCLHSELGCLKVGPQRLPSVRVSPT